MNARLALLVSLAVVTLGAFSAADGLAKGVKPDKLGTPGPDTMHGGQGPNRIDGRDGNDSLYGFGDHDQLWGGEGDDLLDGGRGKDRLLGGVGQDRLDGRKGRDILYSASWDDTADELYGGPGVDVCYGDAIDVISTSCEAVGRDDGPSGADGIPGLVCVSRCKLVIAKYPSYVYDANGDLIGQPLPNSRGER